jgi:hypothetical protein
MDSSELAIHPRSRGSERSIDCEPQIDQTGKQEPLAASELNEHDSAYELFEQRRRGEGNELDDWGQAESEVLGSGRKVQAA